MFNKSYDPNDRSAKDKVEEEISILEAYTGANTLDDESETEAFYMNLD